MVPRSWRWWSDSASAYGESAFGCWATSRTLTTRPKRSSCGLFLNRTKFAGRSKYGTWVHAIAGADLLDDSPRTWTPTPTRRYGQRRTMGKTTANSQSARQRIVAGSDPHAGDFGRRGSGDADPQVCRELRLRGTGRDIQSLGQRLQDAALASARKTTTAFPRSDILTPMDRRHGGFESFRSTRRPGSTTSADAEFDEQLPERVNRSLVASQLLDHGRQRFALGPAALHPSVCRVCGFHFDRTLRNTQPTRLATLAVTFAPACRKYGNQKRGGSCDRPHKSPLPFRKGTVYEPIRICRRRVGRGTNDRNGHHHVQHQLGCR